MNGAPYSRWQDAMFAQQRLLRDYDSEKGIRYLLAFVDDMNAKHHAEEQRDPRILASIHYQSIREADPVWVSDECCDLIDHARHSFEPEPVRPTDPFCQFGFALFAKPLIIDDAPPTELHPGRSPDGKVPVRALAWLPIIDEETGDGCFWISYFVHIDDDLARPGGDPRWTGMEDQMRRIMPLSVAHLWQWSWSGGQPDEFAVAPWERPDDYHLIDEDYEAVAARGKQQVQLVQTIWRLGSQVVPTKARAQRQMRREATRRKMRQTEDVTVITLRRQREGPADDREPSGRELTVQHLVRGYWARRHTREGVRQVWVRPHIKGGDHLPFKQTTRAWEFTR